MPPPPSGEAAPAASPEGIVRLEDLEKAMLHKALEEAGGNQTKAAALLGISRDAVRYKMKKHGLL
jgi:two-component system response regulator AtoC